MNRLADNENLQATFIRIFKELDNLRVRGDEVEVIAKVQQEKVNIQTDRTSDIFERAVRNPMEDELDANRQNILNINGLAATELSSDVAKFNSLTVGGAAITGGGSTTFVSLTDTPTQFSGNAEKTVKVNSTESALEFADFSFIGLADTPTEFGTLARDAGKTVKVNADGNGLEFVNSSSVSTFIGLTDTPTEFGTSARDAGKTVRVNAAGNELEFGPTFPPDLVVTQDGTTLSTVTGSGGSPTNITIGTNPPANWIGTWGNISLLPALGTSNITNVSGDTTVFDFNRATIVYMVHLDAWGTDGTGAHGVDVTQWWVHSKSTSPNHNEHWAQNNVTNLAHRNPTTLYWKIFPPGPHTLDNSSATFFFKPFPS